MKFKATMILGLVMGASALLLAGCGHKEQSGPEVKMKPRMSSAEMDKGHELVADNCGGCHTQGDGGRFSRISDIRKTPEGWDMTIARMINYHGLDILPDDRRAIVKYLADRQGLAPSETAAFRYVLERRPNYQEKGHDPDLMHMCGRCHTYARFALQRRDKPEWILLANMHAGQWPSIEYQMYARERDWWVDATHEVPDKLAKAFPFSTPAWEAWKTGGTPVMEGVWRVTGHRPGKGDYEGTATITTSPEGKLDTLYKLNYADGTHFEGTTTATIFTGYEWRGHGTLDGKKVDEVYEITDGGRKISGRWFQDAADEIGGSFVAERMKNPAIIMSVSPAYVKPGQTVQVTVNGVGLKGSVDLGDGITVTPVSADAGKVVVKATVDAKAATGLRHVKVGKLTGGDLTVYNKVDSVRVTPGYAVARAGGAGGPIPPVTAQFEAVGYMNGPDGKAGTADDIRIGIMPATWATEAFNATAAKMKDVTFAGHIDASGQFMPGPAGPNPKRAFDGGNAGNLSVVATVKDGAEVVTGKSHLIVTVQRWNSPPIH